MAETALKDAGIPYALIPIDPDYRSKLKEKTGACASSMRRALLRGRIAKVLLG